MKIYFTSIQDLSRDVNGVACHARDLRDHLERRGHTVTLLTPYSSQRSSSLWYSRCRRVLYKAHKKTGSSAAYYLILKLLGSEICAGLKNVPAPIDIVNAHDVITARAALKAAGGKVPVFLTCHFWTDPVQEFLNAGLIQPESESCRRLKKQVTKTLRHPALHLVPVSSRNRDLLVELAGKEILERTRVIHLGVSPPAAPAPSKRNFQEPVIVNVGKVERRKNQRFLLHLAKAFARLKRPCKFLLVGPEDAEERAFLEREIRRWRLEDRIVFMGRRSREEVFEIMRGASLYFHTSLEESFGMTLIEAMSVGLPVFALRYDAVKEILPATPEAVIEPDASPEKVAKTLMDYLDHSKRLNTLTDAQGAVYREKFTLERMTERFEALYKSCLPKERGEAHV